MRHLHQLLTRVPQQSSSTLPSGGRRATARTTTHLTVHLRTGTSAVDVVREQDRMIQNVPPYCRKLYPSGKPGPSYKHTLCEHYSGNNEQFPVPERILTSQTESSEIQTFSNSIGSSIDGHKYVLESLKVCRSLSNTKQLNLRGVVHTNKMTVPSHWYLYLANCKNCRRVDGADRKTVYGANRHTSITSIRRHVFEHVARTFKQPFLQHCAFSTSSCKSKHQGDDDHERDLMNKEELESAEYQQMFSDEYFLPGSGHRIFILQPDVKWGEKKKRHTSADLQLLEACALIETLPGWRIVEKATYSLKNENKKYIYGKGNFLTITSHIKNTMDATAVFVNVDMLTALQLLTLQNAWNIPVYDRYTIVLQIFQNHARTHEAKLQVALAEIPYLRSRLRGIHEGSLGKQQGGLSVVGGCGETFLEIRQRLLRERELKLKTALKQIRLKRKVLKQGRKQRELPSVAVVGYTNAGKTSLIKALTRDPSLEPRNQLFATLDVTAHTGHLGHHLKVLYIDTVGFMSDLPIGLIASFSATLEDMLEADVIVHVYDVSHPDITAQRENVRETLSQMSLPQSLTENIIHVANKVDLLGTNDAVGEDDGSIFVSAVTGEGLPELAGKIHQAVIASTDRIQKHMKIPMTGPLLSWLYKEATVENVKDCPDDSESLLVSVLMTQAQHAKFQAQFGSRPRKQK